MKSNWKFMLGIGVAGLALGTYLFVRKASPPAQMPPSSPGVEIPAPPAGETFPPPAEEKPSVAIQGANPGEWTMDFDAAKALAAEKDLPLLLGFVGSDWCGWCRWMDKQIFSQEAWKAYAKEHFVLVWLDYPQDPALVPPAFAERNAKLMQDLEIGGIPTYLLLDSDGQTRLGTTGASEEATPESFIATLEDLLLVSDKSIAARKEQMTDEQKAEVDAAQEARKIARGKLDGWVQTNPEPSEENDAIYQSMKEEIAQADAALLQLLKAAK